MKIDILILSRYSRQGASSRLRTMQYLPYLADAGLQVEFASFFDDNYIDGLYSGRRSINGSMKYFLGRLKHLRIAADARVIWLEKEALPWLPWAIEKQILPKGVPIVSDFDDAVFHIYDRHRLALVRVLLGRKHDRVMAASRVVFAGNDYLADRARAAGAVDIRHIPTVVDVKTYGHHPQPAGDGKLRVGWIGTPRTWAEHGVPLMSMLSDVMAQQGAVFRSIGAGQPAVPVPGFEFLNWSEETEINLIQGLDIGIMPLQDTPFNRGKCGYKLIQYMACGLPVIASPVGVNNKIVEHGVNGFLAESTEEWRWALAALLSNSELRRRMGEAGRNKVVAYFSIQSVGPRVVEIFKSIIATGR